MIILSGSAIDTMTLSTAQAVSTIEVHASFMDYNGTVVTPGNQNTSITGATTTTVVSAATSGVFRNVKALVVYNSNASSSCQVTVNVQTIGTAMLVNYTLQPGESLFYFDSSGFVVMDAAGGLKMVPMAGRNLNKVTVLTNASGTFTTGPATNNIKIRVQAGGGQGGGAPAGSVSTATCGGGGAAGGYAEKEFAVSPNTAYSYTNGPGGTTGTTGTGQAGASSTFVVGSVTVTANGGPGGLGSMAAGSTVLTALGGAAPSVSTNGDVNSSGSPGGGAYRLSGTIASSGVGGSSLFGPGGNAVNTDSVGNAASIGNGGGGGGGASLSTTARNGGAGGNGCIVVEEYS